MHAKSLYRKKRKEEYHDSGPHTCRSPLNMGHEEANLFLNFWNLNQSFYLKGVTTKARFNKLLHILQKRCPTAAVCEDS
eukprot:CAMPEP_0185620060 /NCGR_PEP_ID=MMETSP0436-20130131/52836_1 /TAXON_ID=626734 ORGANISM="Favella taraikaensis, Strain Fe Narragansett Bay" /NCGR_SAMPLE_ID=MMETSP0436 /ASSEMBLY_ACC=CAM_ASM_000390 /LENGTH=78 /DNA_ID=CAMNT_0028260119 /DNA_START=285 /DNA_END=521 /DNA_ORIENTATION=+